MPVFEGEHRPAGSELGSGARLVVRAPADAGDVVTDLTLGARNGPLAAVAGGRG